ncbi:TRNA binding domain containing protein [Histomonas meleagridis]|uniref:TRNA binding domain containing protein n=1 Tax=Histomonas meleagridis TaxID=135588 RepID=UPI003559F2DE|nr:TRNA binding domain containing protein [Histomonas meleagridis]KAH0798381.1 TRNA binding domain containing protein [Histomonas meleagridis]
MSIKVPAGYQYKTSLEIVAKYIGFNADFNEDTEITIPTLKVGEKEICGFVSIANEMARTTKVGGKLVSKRLLADGDAQNSALIEQFTSIADSIFNETSKSDVKAVIGQIQSHIKTMTYLVSDTLTMADILMFLALYPSAKDLSDQEKKSDFADVVRWMLFINSQLGNPFQPIEVQKGEYHSKNKGTKASQQKGNNQSHKNNNNDQQLPQGGRKAKKQAKPKQPAAPKEPECDPFQMIDVRVSRIVKIWPHPDADTLYCEEIDIGDGVIKRVITGVRNYIPIEEMENRLVVVFTNIKPGKIRGQPSEAMVFAGSNADHSKVELLTPPADTPVGTRVLCGDFVNPEIKPSVDSKGKWWKAVSANNQLTINADGQACYKGVPLRVPQGNITVATLTNCEFH